MKLSTCLLCACLFSTSLSAQKEANHWYFGDYMGLDFSNGEPESDLAGSLGADRGVASISDKDGNLLFYANSGPASVLSYNFNGGVYNRNHQLMPNGTLPGGANVYNAHPMQAALIIPAEFISSVAAQNDSKFYLFNLSQDINTDQMSNALTYSIVDMSLDGGNGDVVVKQKVITDSLGSGMSATINKKNKAYWLAVMRYFDPVQGPNDAYYGSIEIYRVEPNGIYLHSSFQDEICVPFQYLKFSPNGRYLHLAGKVYDFDNDAGVITGYRILSEYQWHYCYDNGNCAEFSADSRVMYLYYPGSTGYCLDQFDLESVDLAGSKIELEGSGASSCVGLLKGSMQLAPNGKIYMSHIYSNPLSVIEHPEVVGSGCNFQVHKRPVERTPWWEFPNFPTNFLAGGGSVHTLDILDSGSLEIFPNPTDGVLNISTQMDFLADATYSIRDQLGQLILSGNINESNKQIDLSLANSGVFYFSICSPKGVITKKLIKR